MKKLSYLVLFFTLAPQLGWALVSTAPTTISGTDGSTITGDGSGNMNVKVSNIVPVSAASLPLPTGAAQDSTVSTMSAKLPASIGQKTMSGSTSVTIASDQAAIPVSVSGGSANTRQDTFTGATNGTTVDVHTAPVKYFSMSVVETGVVTSWTVVLECSLDNSNFTTVLTHTNTSPGTGSIVFGGTTAFPCLYFRSRTSAITLGSGTNVIATILGT